MPSINRAGRGPCKNPTCAAPEVRRSAQRRNASCSRRVAGRAAGGCPALRRRSGVVAALAGGERTLVTLARAIGRLHGSFAGLAGPIERGRCAADPCARLAQSCWMHEVESPSAADGGPRRDRIDGSAAGRGAEAERWTLARPPGSQPARLRPYGRRAGAPGRRPSSAADRLELRAPEADGGRPRRSDVALPCLRAGVSLRARRRCAHRVDDNPRLDRPRDRPRLSNFASEASHLGEGASTMQAAFANRGEILDAALTGGQLSWPATSRSAPCRRSGTSSACPRRR